MFVEVLTLCGNLYLAFGLIHLLKIKHLKQFYEHDVIKSERNISCFVIILMFYRFSNYMSLIERFSPFIDHMYNVFSDIAYFFLLLLIVVLVFTFNFYLIAQNQVDFDIEYPIMNLTMDKNKGIIMEMGFESDAEL